MKSHSLQTSSANCKRRVKWYTARVCSLCLALLLCSLVCVDSRADESALDYASTTTVDELTEAEFTELASLSVALRSAAGLSASSGNITNDVANILSILTAVRYSSSYFRTFPYVYAGSSAISLGTALSRALSDGSLSDPDHSLSYLYQIREILKTFPTNGVDLSHVENSLDSIDAYGYAVSRDVADILTEMSYLSTIEDNQEALAGLLSSFEYGHGSMWSAHLDDTQLGSLLSVLQGVSNSVSIGIGDGLGSLGGGTNLADVAGALGRLEEYVEDIRDDGETEYLTPDSDAVDYVEDTSDMPTTNAVASLVLPDPDLGDNTSILDVLDTSSVEGVLPSLTGADTKLAVLGTKGSNGSVPYVEADLALPPGVQRTMHGVAVWLWRLLFALGVWHIVRDEYSYWTTLGGSAVA